MRISDWSSDVCSSDLGFRPGGPIALYPDIAAPAGLAGRRRRALGMALPVVEGRPFCWWQDGQLQSIAPFRSDEHTSELQSLMRKLVDVLPLEKNNHIHQ